MAMLLETQMRLLKMVCDHCNEREVPGYTVYAPPREQPVCLTCGVYHDYKTVEKELKIQNAKPEHLYCPYCRSGDTCYTGENEGIRCYNCGKVWYLGRGDV